VRSVVTDVAFWALTPLATKAITYVVLAAVIGWFVGGPRADTPVGRQPFWLQFLQVAVVGDLIHYWTHRLFHRPTFWPMHAVHHSPTELDWLSAMRLHPLNDLATRMCQALPVLAAGYDTAAVALYIPIVVFWVVLSHADLPWTFGPLRFVLVSPVFHQWHHSSEAEAVDRNFAGMFSFWDVVFGTYHLPRGRRPDRFGVTGPAPARNVTGLLWHPIAAWAGQLKARSARCYADPP
jgi:sterol desaturase/sphingolipid hydroxylase (fatty acid hydroxylase superfamily)